MNVNAIQAVGTDLMRGAAASSAATAAAPALVGDWFTQQVAQANHQLARVDADAQALASGQAVSLHQVMINLEEAKLSFDLLAQVRNRLLESYQEVMRTQV
jgi:flagellar hook-basal body complex protein FliE